MTSGDAQLDPHDRLDIPETDPPLVFIATICGGSLRVEYVHSLITTATDPSTGVKKIQIEPSGPYLDDARNVVITRCLESPTPFEYLLFIDSDISWSPQNVRDIVSMAEEWDRPAVFSGAYSSKREKETHVVAGRRDPLSNEITMMTVAGFDEIKHLRAYEVDGCGAGFLLIPRSLIIEFLEVYGYPSPWFDEPIIDGVHLGEDYGFCVRATERGYPIYLVPSVKLIHSKVIGLALD